MPVYPDTGDPLTPGIFSALKGWTLPGPLPPQPTGQRAGQASGRVALLESEEIPSAISAVSLVCRDQQQFFT